jgi:glyoxylase-like metal-dependent hydrolase (beta-lactamase superfamily II)
VVLTHHHSDHAGGFREYVAEGATIVTTAGTKSAFERAAATESSPLTIETIENRKRVFQDDKHIVELYDIGPNPYANENLVAYLSRRH